MRKLILTQLFVGMAVFASTCAQAQWTEVGYSTGSAQLDATQYKDVNNTQYTLYQNGTFTFLVKRIVTEDWWSSFEEIPSDPLWRSGFQVVEDVSFNQNLTYAGLEIPPGYRPKAVLPYSIELGSNGWDYSYQGLVGNKTRQREWHSINVNGATITAVPGS